MVEVSDHTGFPEMMDGRVKTLHPKIHGGILGRRGTDDEVMSAHNIPPIDLVVVNLYPFEATVAHSDCTLKTRWKILISAGQPWFVRQRRTTATSPLWYRPGTTIGSSLNSNPMTATPRWQHDLLLRFAPTNTPPLMTE